MTSVEFDFAAVIYPGDLGPYADELGHDYSLFVLARDAVIGRFDQPAVAVIDRSLELGVSGHPDA